MKVIEPLFLDDLKEELSTIVSEHKATQKSSLKKFQKKLRTLTFFDPACGCGNFLIVAYREIRLLEMEVLDYLYPQGKRGGRPSDMPDIKELSIVDVDQFYGIEINEFPAKIAEAALWITDHQMNRLLGDRFGEPYVRLPLRTSPHIFHANAMHIDWKDKLHPNKCSYILGNPPFSGSSMQSAEQKKDKANILHNFKKAGVLDYVSLWFVRTAEYIQNTTIQAAFVSTNSITQGEQVSILWKPLCEQYGIKINFAHRTFKWDGDDTHEKSLKPSAVYVVIIGFATFDKPKKYIFTYNTPSSEAKKNQVKLINPYLTDMLLTFVCKRSKPLIQVPTIKKGSEPTDGGHFLMMDDEKKEFLKKEPKAKKFIKPLISAEEYLSGKKRWVLWLKDADLTEYSKLPLVMNRIEKVKEYRSKKTSPSTRKYSRHHLFKAIKQPTSNYLLIPRTTSENRDYVPMNFFTKNDIINDSCQAIPDATLYHFGILQSKMHMTWMKTVCGRLESRYRYSGEIVYNNFPWPKNPTEAQKQKIEEAAQIVLDTRAAHPNANLAELYNTLTMPDDLRKAHTTLDKLVDKAYRKEQFNSEDEMERIKFLFELYQHYIEEEANNTPKGKKTKVTAIDNQVSIEEHMPIKKKPRQAAANKKSSHQTTINNLKKGSHSKRAT